MKKIRIEIGKDGQVDVQPQGYEGTSCQEATKFIEESLGQVIKSEPTSAMWESTNDQNTRQVH